MLSFSSPTQARYPTLDILSENEEQISEASFSASEVSNSSSLSFLFKYAFLVIFSPIWVVLSLLVEILIVPLSCTCHFIGQSCKKWYWLILAVILSPLMYAGIMIISALFSPISLAAKVYGFNREDNFFVGLRNLLYPEKHPIFDSWLNQNQRQGQGYHQAHKKRRYLSSAETQKSYPVASFGFGPPFKEAEDPTMGYKAFYLSHNEV